MVFVLCNFSIAIHSIFNLYLTEIKKSKLQNKPFKERVSTFYCLLFFNLDLFCHSPLVGIENIQHCKRKSGLEPGCSVQYLCTYVGTDVLRISDARPAPSPGWFLWDLPPQKIVGPPRSDRQRPASHGVVLPSHTASMLPTVKSLMHPPRKSGLVTGPPHRL